MEFENIIKSILEVGPDRVLVDENTATTMVRAEKMGRPVRLKVVFVRNDGWSLGAGYRHVAAAYRTWSDSWTHFILYGTGRTVNIYPIVQLKIGKSANGGTFYVDTTVAAGGVQEICDRWCGRKGSDGRVVFRPSARH